MAADHVLAIDQGTTSTRAILFDAAARPGRSARGAREVAPGAQAEAGCGDVSARKYASTVPTPIGLAVAAGLLFFVISLVSGLLAGSLDVGDD